MDLKKVLKKEGKLAEVTCERSRTFDMAFSKERAYLIKVVSNVEGLSNEIADKLLKSAAVIGAEPIVIGEHGKEPLKDDVVYTRHGVPVMKKETFIKLTNGECISMAVRGGLRVPIKHLKEFREKVSMSRNTLAKLLEVSTEMIRKYEENLASPGEEVAKRLVEIFGTDLLEPFEFKQEKVRKAILLKAPFDIAIKKKKAVLISFKKTKERVRDLRDVSDVVDAEPVLAEPDEVF